METMQKKSIAGTDLLQGGIKELAEHIAQEVWNPLTVIKTMMYAMGADLAAEDPRRADFQVVNREIDRMERSIQQFLDYTRPPEPVLAPVSLDHIVAEAVERLSRRARAQEVHIETSVDPGVRVLADQHQMEQVFVNLGMNALRAMPHGGKLSLMANTERVFARVALDALPAVTGGTAPPIDGSDVSTPRRPTEETSGDNAASASVGITVTDTGDGIPADLIGRVFEAFVIAAEEGSGLDLAIVQQMVTRHGGQIAGHSNPKGGATFLVTLPLVQV